MSLVNQTQALLAKMGVSDTYLGGDYAVHSPIDGSEIAKVALHSTDDAHTAIAQIQSCLYRMANHTCAQAWRIGAYFGRSTP